MYFGDSHGSFGGYAFFLFIHVESVTEGERYCLAFYIKVLLGECSCQWEGRVCL